MFMKNSGIGRAAAALLLCMAAVSPAQAAFPERPVKLVVPYTPGGAADLLSRVLAERLSQELAQPVVVENKPGANTMIAATQVARAQPDGYTLFLASNASMVLNPMLYRKISYDAQRLPVLPDVPTVAESGFAGFRAATWFGVAVPRGTPPAEADRLREAVAAVMRQADFRDRFQAQGLVIQAPRGQAEVDAYLAEDRERWNGVIQANHIRLD